MSETLSHVHVAFRRCATASAPIMVPPPSAYTEFSSYLARSACRFMLFQNVPLCIFCVHEDSRSAQLTPGLGHETTSWRRLACVSTLGIFAPPSLVGNFWLRG
jgi:hypothetical protein